ncbi:MAG: ABC transporter ATP-binding protein [Planctomycetia bacterium]|nr:ABC transporter ATP-binding protein [Planctomycetia bacterium]
MPLLQLRNVVKSYAAPDGATAPVLDVASFSLEAGEHVALRGASGSGKTTLLNVIAGIVVPDAGEVVVDGTDVARLSEPARDAHRARTTGYVFQAFNLLQGFTALENVALGMLFGGIADPARARGLLERVGLGDRMSYFPRQLSLGQQQRVAVARALANRPKLVLADEPTGSLDAASGAQALALIREVCREAGAALLLVSHDAEVLGAFEKRLELAAINRAPAGATP